MIRLYKYLAEYILMVAGYTKTQGVTNKHLVNWAQAYMRSGEDRDLAYVMERFFATNTESLTELPALIELLKKQIDEADSPNGDGDLVDKMVALLGLPYGRNRITQKSLGALRQALLLPSEMHKFITSAERDTGCATCGRALASGEMVTIVHGEGANGIVAMHCSNCLNPTYIGCAFCKESYILPKKLVTFFKSIRHCGCQDEDKGVQTIKEDTPYPGYIPPILNRHDRITPNFPPTTMGGVNPAPRTAMNGLNTAPTTRDTLDRVRRRLDGAYTIPLEDFGGGIPERDDQ